MTKKVFVSIAARIRDNMETAYSVNCDETRAVALGAHKRDAGDLADVFEEANPRFNRIRFLTACGVELYERNQRGY